MNNIIKIANLYNNLIDYDLMFIEIKIIIIIRYSSQKKGVLELNKSYLGEGIFFIVVMTDLETRTLKLIIE